jgi:uncharacterized protein YjbI with pentapeptide repeats
MWILLFTLIVITVLIVIFLPILQLRFFPSVYGLNLNSVNTHEDKVELITLENELRRTILQLSGGVFLLIGVAFSWNQYTQTKERDFSEKLNKTIALMGNDKEYVRIAAVHSLKHVSSNHESGNSVIIDILSSFLRDHAAWKGDLIRERGDEITRAALQVISKALHQVDNVSFDLSEGDFRAIDLKEVNLSGGVILNSYFESSDLKNGEFVNAILTGSSFNSSNLENVSFEGADLRYVSFKDTVIKNVDFSGANLSGATGIDWSQINDFAITNSKTISP